MTTGTRPATGQPRPAPISAAGAAHSRRAGARAAAIAALVAVVALAVVLAVLSTLDASRSHATGVHPRPAGHVVTRVAGLIPARDAASNITRDYLIPRRLGLSWRFLLIDPHFRSYCGPHLDTRR